MAVTVPSGASTSDPIERVNCRETKGVTTASSPRCAVVTVRSGSSMPCTRPSPRCVIGTMNGFGLSITKRRMPFAMRRSVFSASGRLRPKIDGQGIVQSMQSAAVRQIASPGLDTVGAAGLPWVSRGQTIA